MFIRDGGLWRQQAFSILCLVCALGAGGCSKPAQTAAAEAPGKAAPAAAKTPQTVLAETKFGEVTLKDLDYYAQTRLCKALNDLQASTQTTPRTADTYAPVIQWIASCQAAEAEAMAKAKTDPKLAELCESGIKPQIDALVLRTIVRTEIRDRATTPTQEEIRDYYKKHEQLYFQPFSVTLRMLLLQTYEPYIAQTGDTLESIAQRVSGDAAQAANIRANVPSRPLRREPGKMAVPLYPGEKLLVPMSKERMAEVRARLEAIVKDVRAIKDPHDRDMRFLSLAKKYDESGLAGEITTPVPTGTRQSQPPLPQIMDAVRQTTVGQVSQVFQTKHGFQAVEVMDRVESHSLPLDHPVVRKDVLTTMMDTRTKRAVDDLMSTLIDDPDLKVDYAQIARGNALSTPTVVAVLGEEKLLWQDLKGTWTADSQPTVESKIRKMLYHNQPLAMMLFRKHLSAQLADPKTELGRQVQCLRTALIGSTYLTKLATDDISTRLTKARAEAYYKQNLAKYTESAKVAFTAAMWPIPDPKLKPEARAAAAREVLKQYQEALKPVKTEQDFLALKEKLDGLMTAQNLSSDQYGAPEPIAVSALSTEMRHLFEGVQPGHWTQPAVIGNVCAASFLVRQRVPEKVLSFDEARSQINRELYISEFDGVFTRLAQQYAQQAGVRITLKGSVIPGR